MSKCDYLKSVSASMNNFLTSSFQKYAGIFYPRPYVLILISLLLAGPLFYGNTMYIGKSKGFERWIPEDAESLKNKDTVEDAYETSFEIQQVYVVAKEEGLNLLTPEVFEQIIRFQETLWRDFSVEEMRFNDVCFKSSDSDSNESSCETSNSPLLFFLKSDASFDRSSLTSRQALLDKINSGKGTPDFYSIDSILYISVEEIFGRTSPEDVTTSQEGTNDIEEAQAIRWTYYIAEQLSLSTEEKVFREIEAIIEKFNNSNDSIQIYPYSRSLKSKAVHEEVQENIIYIYFAIVLLILYSFFVLGQLNTYRSRLLIGVCGLLGVVIAYFEAIGLGAYLGIEGNILVNTIPFLLFGIGLDDMYVLVHSLDEAPANFDGKEKFQHMMKNAGVSITITSLTNIFAFAIGAISAIPVIRNYCIFLSFGIFFDYFNQISFFLGVLAYDIRRSEKERGDCCGLVFCKPTSSFCCKGKYIFDDSGEPQIPLSQRIIENIYGKILMKKVSKSIVIVFFVLLTGLNIYGIFQSSLKFDTEWFVEEEYLIHHSIRIREEYFETKIQKTVFYTVGANFEKRETQQKIEALEELIESCEGCEKKWIVEGSTISWYSAFKDWVRREQCIVDNQKILLQEDIVPSEYFYYCLIMWASDDEGKLYSSALAWGDSTLKAAGIKTSLILPKEVSDLIQAIDNIRDIGKQGPHKTFPFSEIFLWSDQFAVFEFETIVGISSCLGVVFLILLFSFAGILESLLPLLMLSLTVLGQLSLLHFWGEYLNSLTITFAIAAIGVSVDYSAHFVHSYKLSTGCDRNEKVIKTLGSIGTSIFDGFMSTFLGILPLALSTYYPYVIFFKCWFGILVYSVFNALVLLPVLLSFFNLSHEDETEKRDNNRDEKEMISLQYN